MDESAQDALRIAEAMIDAGIPVFVAPPCPAGPFGQGGACERPGHGGGAVEYDLPARWQQTAASKVWLDRWQPGYAMAAVGGHVADFLDEDPRNGGEASVTEMMNAGHWPTVFGVQETPSGGRHYLISPLGERKVTNLLPGLDYQGGAPDGQGRGFVWIAPTVKRSKDPADAGVVKVYRWVQDPDLEWLSDFGPGGDDSIDGVRLRIEGYRARRTEGMASARADRSSAPRTFTPAAMEHFLQFTENAVRTAQIGEIEERANAYACALSHFVPAMLTAEQAYDRLTAALGETAYDPAHPASQWEASKFLAVISDIGGRAPADWHAVPDAGMPGEADFAEAVTAVDPQGDEVSALLAEMLPPSVLVGRTPPRYLIKGLLTLDSTPWLIGGPGSKKSFVALDLAAHVALGLPWQGRKVKKAIVVMIMGEGAGSIGKRIKAWQSKYGVMPDDAIRVLPRPVQAADPAKWAVLVRACERLRSVIDDDMGMFVVIDTQARATVGLDENSAEQMGVYVAAVTALKEVTRGCVMSVHHTTKAGQSTRGSGALDGAQDTRLLMESKPGTLEGKLAVKKQKDLEEGEPIDLRFAKVIVGQDEDGEDVDSLVILPEGDVSWHGGVFDDKSAEVKEREQMAAVTPFAVRFEPDSWTHEVTDSKASVQRWLLQALADAGLDRGLTQAELRDLVATKIGKFAGPRSTKQTMDSGTWREAFQQVTDGGHAARLAGIVIERGERWTVDRVALQALQSRSGEPD